MSALGLGDYGSSDEESDAVATSASIAPADKPTRPLSEASSAKALQPVAQSIPIEKAQPSPPNASIGPALGPAPGPAAMPSDVTDRESNLPYDNGSVPSSPYTANRLQVRNLTMPPIPSFEIPPSPPGSPPPATTAKFARFLEFKKKGVHFNERLSQSAALRNPGLLAKQMDFAGISQEDQYASSLPESIAVPTRFPEWAYADKLVAAHSKIAKKREEERAKVQREAVDFVPAKRVESEGASKGRRSRFDDMERRDGRRSRSPR